MISGDTYPSFITQSKRDNIVLLINTVFNISCLKWLWRWLLGLYFAIIGITSEEIKIKTVDDKFDTSSTSASFDSFDTLVKYLLSLSSSSLTTFFSVNDASQSV